MFGAGLVQLLQGKLYHLTIVIIVTIVTIQTIAVWIIAFSCTKQNLKCERFRNNHVFYIPVNIAEAKLKLCRRRLSTVYHHCQEIEPQVTGIRLLVLICWYFPHIPMSPQLLKVTLPLLQKLQKCVTHLQIMLDKHTQAGYLHFSALE